jgi:DNA-binding CsgD family transcriptional regulator
MDAQPIGLSSASILARCVLGILDHMNCGGLLVDAGKRVLALNPEAEKHVGRGIRLKGGHLHAAEARSDIDLQALLGMHLSGSDRTANREAIGLLRVDKRPLLMRLVPLDERAQDLLGGARLICVLIDPEECPQPSPALLQQLFGLSRSEAAVAVGVMCGQTLQEIAHGNNKTVGTVRAQTKSLFEKTQTSRQAELVGLLTRLAVISGKRP